MPSLEMERWPEPLRGQPIAGVYVGGCVSRGDGSRFRHKAHTHIKVGSEHRGWICYLSEKRLTDNAIAIHELAHALSGSAHTDKWRRQVVALGGTLDATDTMRDYHKRGRIGRYRGLGKPHSAKCPCGGK